MTGARYLLGLGILCGACAPGAAHAAPAMLKGKSVVVTFTENRVQRDAGWPDFRSRSFGGEYDVYVGETGRAFSRLRLTNQRAHTGAQDRVGNTGAGVTTFQGDTMTVTDTLGTGARRVVVKFAPGFSSCEASVMRAKQQGADMIRTKSIIHPGLAVEIRSVEITGVSCRIENGNVFAGR